VGGAGIHAYVKSRTRNFFLAPQARAQPKAERAYAGFISTVFSLDVRIQQLCLTYRNVLKAFAAMKHISAG
jgi:hypothetical protein